MNNWWILIIDQTMMFIVFARNLTFCNSSAVETMKVMVDTNTCQFNHQSLSKQKTLKWKVRDQVLEWTEDASPTPSPSSPPYNRTMKREKQARNWARLLVHGYSMVLHSQERHWKLDIREVPPSSMRKTATKKTGQMGQNIDPDLSKGAHTKIFLLCLLQHLDDH